jgi:integrase
MSEKRKDNRGRILRTGESQRKDGIYQYRYADILGTRRYIYDADLNKLREKEKYVQKQLDQGLDYANGKMTVVELYEQYVDTKRNARENTKKTYAYFAKVLRNDAFSKKEISKVKPLDAKKWLIKLHDSGLSYGTLKVLKAAVGGAFKMACEEDIISKNPCAFSLSSIISNDTTKKEVLSLEQQKAFLSFVRKDAWGSKYYDVIIVLLNTGMRIGELSGLIIDDIDFEKRRIKIDHQLQYYDKNGYVVEKVKSRSGNRMIPMSDDVYESLKRVLNNRKQIEREFEDYVFLNRNGRPITSTAFAISLKRIITKYNNCHQNDQLPNITPHSFRHMFCSNMVKANMNAKTLQYIMGHADISMTLNVYSHIDYDAVEKSMLDILNADN